MPIDDDQARMDEEYDFNMQFHAGRRVSVHEDDEEYMDFQIAARMRRSTSSFRSRRRMKNRSKRNPSVRS